MSTVQYLEMRIAQEQERMAARMRKGLPINYERQEIAVLRKRLTEAKLCENMGCRIL